MTDARSWQQLWMDFGLLRSKMPRGGDHGGGAASHARSLNNHEIELMNSLDQWNLIIRYFREFALSEKRAFNIPPATLEQGMASIRECCRVVDKIIAKG
jgi:hypothetical protein